MQEPVRFYRWDPVSMVFRHLGAAQCELPPEVEPGQIVHIRLPAPEPSITPAPEGELTPAEDLVVTMRAIANSYAGTFRIDTVAEVAPASEHLLPRLPGWQPRVSKKDKAEAQA